MNIAVVSYSYTGNNELLAAAVASILGAEHIRVAPAKPYKMGDIVKDMLFGRIPEVTPDPSALLQYDRLIFFAPIWMGKAAAPIRAYLRQIKARPAPYAFATVSGGSLGANPGITKDITKRAGAKPFAVALQYIANLLPSASKPSPEQVGAFRLSRAQAEQLAQAVAQELREKSGMAE